MSNDEKLIEVLRLIAIECRHDCDPHLRSWDWILGYHKWDGLVEFCQRILFSIREARGNGIKRLDLKWWEQHHKELWRMDTTSNVKFDLSFMSKHCKKVQ